MSDPFSIASGAVGIISLGIQLCKQITDYAEAWRGYDEDIESIGFKAESLKGPLRKLRDFVEDTRVTDSDTANDIADKASELERCLKRLENRLAQAKPIISDSLKEKLQNRMKKFSYPVRARDALCEIKSDLDSVQSSIQLALTIFHAQQAQNAYHFQEKTFKLVEDIHLTVSTLSRNSMPAPALLKSLCDRGHECSKLNETSVYSQFDSNAQEDLDTEACLVSAITPSTTKHTYQISTKKLFQYYSAWLHREITLLLSLSSGAGAFSIAPALEINVYRGEHSWINEKAFEALARFDHNQRSSCSNFEQLYEDELIRDCQQAMSAGKFSPRDIDGNGSSAIGFLLHCYNSRVGLFNRFGLSNFIRFLIARGFKLDNPKDWFIRHFFHVKWTEDDYKFALYLVDHGASMNFMPYSKRCKNNVRRILRWDTSHVVNISEIVRAIVEESEPKLRELLQRGDAKTSDHTQGLSSLLELAVWWPEGVRILLELGADASKVNLELCAGRPCDVVDEADLVRYVDSIVPLLQGGCALRINSIMRCKSEKVRFFMIDEYAKRRRKLRDIAQSCLPLEEFTKYLSSGGSESLLDVHSSRVYANLIKNGWPVQVAVDCSLENDLEEFVPIYYHHITASDGTDPWDDFYQAGFRDIDIPDFRGLTPLMTCALHFMFNEKAAIWLVDKGATPSRRLPFSRTTVAHLMSSRVTENLHKIMTQGDRNSYEGRLHKLIGTIKERKDSVFLIPSVQDCCMCACCEGGCTTLVVGLRNANVIQCRYRRYSPASDEKKQYYFLLLSILIDLTDRTKERDRSIIRLFTFEALGLRHTCCRHELNMLADIVLPPQRIRDYQAFKLDDDEVQSIQDEDELRYRQLEKLVSKFNALFDQLELTILDFLKGPWQEHMAEFLSRRDPYNDDHIQEARELGIFLEPTPSGLYEAPPFFYLLSKQVEDVESEDDVSNDDEDEFGDTEEAEDGTSNSSAST